MNRVTSSVWLVVKARITKGEDTPTRITNKEIFALNFLLRIIKEINEIPRNIKPLTMALPFPIKK